MSVVRGRPPGFGGGISGSRRRNWSSLRAWPLPKSPTRARSSGVHIGDLHQRDGPLQTAVAPLPITGDQPAPRPCQTGSESRAGAKEAAVSEEVERGQAGGIPLSLEEFIDLN